MANEEAVLAAFSLMQAHIEALNNHDESALAATLHFPHYRLSGTNLAVWESAESYFTDFKARSGGQWAHSAFKDIRVVQTSANKVHLDAEINRYNSNNEIIARFRSLWVITHEDGRWAAKFRSSFAAT